MQDTPEYIRGQISKASREADEYFRRFLEAKQREKEWENRMLALRPEGPSFTFNSGGIQKKKPA